MYILTSEGNHIVLFTAQIRSLLKITNDLIDICYESYDGRSGANDTLTKESVDFMQASGQLVELRSNLENLFKIAATNGAHSLGIGISVDELLSRYKDEISEMETMLKQKSLERIKGQSSSLNSQAVPTSPAPSTNTPKGVVEENFRCVCTLTKKFNADNVHKGPLLEPVL